MLDRLGAMASTAVYQFDRPRASRTSAGMVQWKQDMLLIVGGIASDEGKSTIDGASSGTAYLATAAAKKMDAEI